MNIIGYMIFSGLEVFAVTMLMLSMFSYNIKYYKTELLITTISITLSSYLLVLLNLDSYLMLVMIVMFVSLFKFLFKGTIKKSIIVVVVGYLIFVMIQVGIVLLAKDFLTAADMSNPYSFKTYLFQFLDSTITLIVAGYIHYFAGGFGFNLKGKSQRVKNFVSSAIFSAIIASIGIFTFIQYNYIYLLIVAFVIIALSVLILIIFSLKQDNIEYS